MANDKQAGCGCGCLPQKGDRCLPMAQDKPKDEKQVTDSK